MTRLLGIPAAVVVLVALPGFVSPGTEKKPEPPAMEAALTVNLEGDQGASGHPYLFAVTAAGATPAKPAMLRDETGLHTGIVATAEGCAGPPRVAFPDRPSIWCLRLENVAKGYELSGTASGGNPKTVGARSLKLTVNRRDDFWAGPFWALLAGLLLGIGLALFKAPFRRSVRSTVLGKQLRENEEARGAAQIIDLTKFVRARLAAGETVDDLTPKVAALRQNGPKLAQEARAKLEQSLKRHHDALAHYPLWTAAGKEAARENSRVEDFFDAEGQPITHPASEFLQVVEELVKGLAYIAKLRAAIVRLRKAEHRQPPLEALARAELVAREAIEPTDVRRVAGLLDAARDSVETARAKEQIAAVRHRRGVDGPAGRVAGALPAAPLPSLPPDATELGGARFDRTVSWTVAVAVAAAVAIVLFSLFTIKQAVYDPKLTFSGCGDYFTIFSTALASAAAGSLILLFSYWSPVSVSEE